ncbi:hypothetical protein C8Q80DRAFT_1183512 [Daedaleopsis nitida]|nr:hypothetical protein C8Q80DRAFT_1183512 [Daedaleopsis nitida]
MPETRYRTYLGIRRWSPRTSGYVQSLAAGLELGASTTCRPSGGSGDIRPGWRDGVVGAC